MAAFDLVIRGGTVVTASDTMRCDIGVRDGRIAALAEGLEGGAETIDAGGLLILPGGIDSHVHLAQGSSDGSVMADDFASGTLSALAGGNTTVLPFAVQKRGQSLRSAVNDYHALAEGRCYTDHSFHLILSDPNEATIGQDLPALIAEGYTSLKVFMTYEDMKLNDREMLAVLAAGREHGALVMVHAEGYDAIRFLTDRLERLGRTEPRGHALSRPAAVEREATHRAISLAEIVDVPIMIVHVSSRAAMEQIRWAREQGLKVMGETCPQYLVLTERDLDGMGGESGFAEGEKYVCSPPPRDEESQTACWQGLQQGVFQTFSSDHCPYRYEGPGGKRVVGARGMARTAFRWVPNGIPGVETRLPILFSEGVSKGRIDLNRFVALTATNHAKIYGLYPQKGTIAIGSDADLVFWDPNRTQTIRQDILHHGCDYTPYEGLEVTGWPVRTLLRGKTMFVDGKLVGTVGEGRYLKRGKPQAMA